MHHPPPAAMANFSIMMECTPESGHCHSVCTLWRRLGRGTAPALKEGKPVLVVITFITVVLDREYIGRDPRFLYCCIVWPLLIPRQFAKRRKPQRELMMVKITAVIAEEVVYGWR